MLGNFRQALTHMALMNTAGVVSSSARGEPAGDGSGDRPGAATEAQ